MKFMSLCIISLWYAWLVIRYFTYVTYVMDYLVSVYIYSHHIFQEWVMIYCCIFIIRCSTIFVKIFYHIFEMIDYIIPPTKGYHQVLVWAMVVVFFFHLYWIIVKVSPLSHDIYHMQFSKKRSYRILCDIAMKGTSVLGANFFA